MPPADGGAHVGGDAGRDSGSEPGTDAGDARPSFLAHCLEATRLFCDASPRCCMRPRRTLVRDACIESSSATCEAIAASNELRDGRIVWDRATGADALARAREAAESCAPYQDPRFLGLTGTVPEGGDCTPPSLDRTPEERPAELACAPGLRCQIRGTSEEWTGVCAAPGGEGERCWNPPDCADELYCSYESIFEPTTARCAPKRDTGDPCDSDMACPSGFCVEGICAEPEPGDPWCGQLPMP